MRIMRFRSSKAGAIAGQYKAFVLAIAAAMVGLATLNLSNMYDAVYSSNQHHHSLSVVETATKSSIDETGTSGGSRSRYLAAPMPDTITRFDTERRSDILSDPMDMIRRGIPLNPKYHAPERKVLTNTGAKNTFNVDGECSCRNRQAKKNCCVRIVRRNHKMGYVLLSVIGEQLPKDKIQIQYTQTSKSTDYISKFPPVDYRVALVVRDMYDSLVSGYLYHYTGRECHLDHRGYPLKEGYNPFRNVRLWKRFLKLELDPPANDRSLCQYLKEESEVNGMKAYIDYIFNSQYETLMNNWALAQEIPEFQERTRIVYYDDLSDSGRVTYSVNAMLDFFYNGTDHYEWKTRTKVDEGSTAAAEVKQEERRTTEEKEQQPNEQQQEEEEQPAGDGVNDGHGTSKDPVLRNRLIEAIKQADREFFHGDIAWLNNILLAQRRQ